MPTVTVTHDTERHRYVAELDGRTVGEAVYHDTEEGRVFTHSEIDPAQQGRGYGTQLVRTAVEDTRDAGLQPIGQCSMVRHYLDGHPDPAGPRAS